MSTRNKDASPEALHRAMERQSEGTLDAGAVAKSTIQTLRQVNVTLTPVIGEVGVNVLFKRSLHLTSRTFPWLTIAENHGDAGDFLASLGARLAGRDTKEAVEASSALLAGFTELLATLIGDSLVETLLGSLSASLELPSKQDSIPKQDTTS
ncbi:hypothetical protein SAMN05216369_0599 [Marinobacter antarcticus]|uniref:Uncharacterized protein n=1 Tax=Marinobacter antarcticus TaxID=564117 RepID=A0A1M6PZ47_9GAMM|nr:hypothetical protein [Marinobacter antarcticus]SHK13265.1 hypothetical protein SAMN05216369_0599 [Marinobacter antarcticus]